MSAGQVPPKKKKKKKKKKTKDAPNTSRLQHPTNTLTPTNHYAGSSAEPTGAPVFVGDQVANPSSTSSPSSSPSPRLIHHLLATKIHLFKLDIAKRERIDLGKKVVAIVPDDASSSSSPSVPCSPTFTVIVYEPKSRRLALSVAISRSLSLGILGPTSVSLKCAKNELYSFNFMTTETLNEFVSGCSMAKIPRNEIHRDDHRLLLQDLNNANNEPLRVNSDTHCAHTVLSMWTADRKHHPYRRGKCVFKGEKAVYLNTGKWIMTAVTDALCGMRVGLKRLVIAPPQFGFGEDGNEKLGIRGNCTLIMQIELKSVEQRKRPQNGSDPAMMDLVHSVKGNNNDTKSKGTKTNGRTRSMEMHGLRVENERLKEEILRLNARVKALVAENDKLKATVDAHQMEAVKKKVRLKEVVQNEKDRVQKELNPFSGGSATSEGPFGARFEGYEMDIDYTTKHYLEWNSSDVVDWVLSLGYGSFAKYASLLRKNVPKQSIKGKHVSKLDKSEWRALGVLDDDDCMSIIDHVKALTMEEKKSFANNFDNFANNFDPNINLFD